jgi:hypothetical protein
MNSSSPNSSSMKILVTLIFVISGSLLIDSCIHEPFIDPSSLNNGEPSTPGCVSNGLVCFESSVLPIFISTCAITGCHDSKSRKEGYSLDNYNNIIKKGISPGNSANSKLYKVLFETGENQMPPGAPLSKAQKDSIAAWINQGAKNTVDCNCSCNTSEYTYAAIILPIITNQCVGCHKPSSLGGNIDLSTYSLVKAQATNGKLVGSITHAVGYSPMPQGSKLGDCQITQIKNWIAAGTPNN